MKGQEPSKRHDYNDLFTSVAFAPPPVSATKAKFLQNYKKPIAAIYNTVIQELIVQQHFARYAINYQYNPVGVPVSLSLTPPIMR
jgi:hypothetical protein